MLLVIKVFCCALSEFNLLTALSTLLLISVLFVAISEDKLLSKVSIRVLVLLIALVLVLIAELAALTRSFVLLMLAVLVITSAFTDLNWPTVALSESAPVIGGAAIAAADISINAVAIVVLEADDVVVTEDFLPLLANSGTAFIVPVILQKTTLNT